MSDKTPYPPIADYAYIGDGHSAALVSKSGSIDWLCMPRIDSASCFGRILDWDKGGYCRIAPTMKHTSSRRYVENSLALETTFRTEDGEVRLTDFFPMREGGRHNPYRQIVRIMEGARGSLELAVNIMPRFDYGSVRPWIRPDKSGNFIAMGGSDGLLISGDFDLLMEHRHHLSAKVQIKKGEKRRLCILYCNPKDLEDGLIEAPAAEELDRRLDVTIQWWRSWLNRAHYKGPYSEPVKISAMTLKGLTNAPTGAIAAAPTTSLPEVMHGSRNWDYRYSWIRDSALTVRSLGEIGYDGEADAFRRFVERSAAGHADEIQILFGVGGERRLREYELDELEGYRGARPVRIGNAAKAQMQLDVYGELLELAWRWYERGHEPDDDYWEFLVELVCAAVERWKEPDRGMWEIRGEPLHFVLSKAACWAAADLGIRLSRRLSRTAPVERWERARQEIRGAIEEKGYDQKRGVFIRAFDRPEMDASLLLLPAFGYVEYDDERMIRTTDAVWGELAKDGFVRRYAIGNDDLEGEEGAFLACSFWMVECLSRQGRFRKAKELFERTLAAGNDLCLFSEEYNPRTKEMLGNFPQGLTHLSLIAAAVTLSQSGAESV